LFFPFSVSMFYNPHVPLPSGKKWWMMGVMIKVEYKLSDMCWLW
jgi:hypothetical protein